MEKNKPSMRELSQRVSKITHRYRQAQIRETINANPATADTEAIRAKNANQCYIEAFEMALNSLLPQHRMIIYNDFINHRFLFWWELQYARSTYYRQKYRALEQFASYFATA